MSLPFELLSYISSFLPISALKTLRLACKTLHDIATPLLFSSIFVSARHVDREIAELVASRFPSSITTLTFSSECYGPSTSLPYKVQSERSLNQGAENWPSCGNICSHLRQTELFWGLHGKLASERQSFYDSGAVQTQLSHLLNTLPNIRQIVITDRRRRQDLSWFQEALMRQTIQCFPTPTICLSRFGQARRAFASLFGLRKKKSLQYTCTWDQDVQALVQPQVSESVRCYCFDREQSYTGGRFGLGRAESHSMPQNPWAEIIKALYESSNVSIHTVTIQPSDANSYLPLAAIHTCDPHIIRLTTMILPRLKKLDLRLDSMMEENRDALVKMYQNPSHPSKMFSTASNLESLTIDFLDYRRNPTFYGMHKPGLTTFDALLGGCQLPRLTTLHLRNFTFFEDELSTLLQHSPVIRDLSLQGFYMVDQQGSMRRADTNPGSWERLLHKIKETLRCLEHFRIKSMQLCDELNIQQVWAAQALVLDLSPKTPRFLFDDGIDPSAELAKREVVSTATEWDGFGHAHS